MLSCDVGKKSPGLVARGPQFNKYEKTQNRYDNVMLSERPGNGLALT